MDVLLDWSFRPLQLGPLLLVGMAYAARARTLARRGSPVPAWRQANLALALVLAALALSSPLDALGQERLFSAHMVQHVLLGDLAALAFVLGLTGPVLRPVLAVPLVAKLRVVGHPLVAFPVWAANLLVWHVPALYEAALRWDGVHALQHVLFFACGALMWWPVVEVLPGPEWFGTAAKLGYVVAVRAVETVLGNVFFWAGDPFYDAYARSEKLWGLTAQSDQGTAGAVMMIEGSVVTILALAWLFLRLAEEGELRQQLLERGLDPRAVRRAVRYGRGEELRAGR